MANKTNITIPSLTNLAPQIYLEGQWQSLDKLANNLRQSIQTGYDTGTKIIGQRILRIVKRALTTGTPPPGSGINWEPHSPHTIKRYGAHNIYNLTGNYANSIGISYYKSRVMVGIPYRTKRSSQGSMTLNQLAILLEYGSTQRGGNIPARPVWSPSLKSLGGTKFMKTELLKQIRRELYKNTGIRANQVK